MKQVKLDDLIFCPLCGTAPVVYTDSRHRFSIQCPRCGARTDWLKKTDAVIKWYNMHHTLQATRFLKANPLVRLQDGLI